MILVDSSVWVDHLRKKDRQLSLLLQEGKVLCHPFVLGELALGQMKNRTEILAHLTALPCTRSASHREVLHWIHHKKLHGRGIGWVDAHLLASALISHCRLWTRDRALGTLVAEFDLAP